MSYKSEHSESEFYYPGELSHAKLLHQSPTHSDSLQKQRKKFKTLLEDEEAHNFLRSQQLSKQAVKETTFR